MTGLSAIVLTISWDTRSLDRDPGKDVGALHRVGQGASVGLDSEALFVRVHALGAALVDHSFGVDQQQVLGFDAEREIEGRAGDAGGAGARKDYPDVADFLAHYLEGIDQGGAGYDGRAVLVIVEDRNVAALLESLFDFEAVGGADVLEIDASDGGRQELAESNDLCRVLAVDLDVEDVDVGEGLEEDALALHHRLARHRPDVAESEDGGAVGHHRHQVSLVGVFVDQLGVARDLEARFRHPGGVGER